MEIENETCKMLEKRSIDYDLKLALISFLAMAKSLRSRLQKSVEKEEGKNEKVEFRVG